PCRQSSRWAAAPAPRARCGRAGLPAAALAQSGDLRHVVATVPGVEGETLGERPDLAGVAVQEGALPGGLGQGLEEVEPAPVQRLEQRERYRDVAGDDVRRRRPGHLVVAANRRPLLRHGQAMTD